MWTGAKVLIMGGAVATGAVAAVAAGLFDSSDWPGGWPPEQPAGMVAEEVGGSGVIDYNCALPGTGCPWLEHLPPSEWETTESDESVTILDGSHLQGFFAATTPHVVDMPYMMWLPMAIGPDGPSMPDVYRTVCAVHPDLGGSGLRQVPADELETLFTAFEAEGEADQEGANRWFTDDVTRSADEAHVGLEAIRLYLLPVLPMGVRQDLTSGSCGTTASGPASEGVDESEEEDWVTWQRWRIELAGDELVDLNPLRWGAPGSRQGVGFHYEITAEFTVERPDDEWVFRSGHITDANIANTLHYEPEGDWDGTQMDCFGSDDYPRVISGKFEDGFLVLGWPEHAANCIVFACHRTRDCGAEPDSRVHFHNSDQFFPTASHMTLSLQEGDWGTPLTNQATVGQATHRVAVSAILSLLDQH